jgi:hypothetical protein
VEKSWILDYEACAVNIEWKNTWILDYEASLNIKGKNGRI